ncbi:methionine aminotransferase [Fulvivirga sp. M361]|uniref:methionine aminotransferase n=1 Tax=Fulvivirga sp. M361 TaxID=2594266 RepID=UPI0021020B7A|nr:methionine aminotransferase [Fulvivirga sp. M361]
MSKLAADHGAINLSQGFPDFEVSPELIALVDNAMKQGHNQYAPMAGLPWLRQVISKMTADRYGYQPNAETEITVTSGATEALFGSIMALLHPGEEVILFDPSYDSYDPVIRLAGGIPVHLNLTYPDFRIDWQQVRDTISGKTRLIIINTPHNPTGSTLPEEDMIVLQGLAEEHNLLVISDEVYEHIIFDEKTHQSVLKFEAMRKRSVAISSFGKTFHATGWKVGYLVASEALTAEIRKIHQFVTFSVSTPVQHALGQYLQHKKNYDSLARFYEQKRDSFLALLEEADWRPLVSSGTYFQLLSYDGMNDKGDQEMAEYLTRKYGLASIPISVFYHDNTDHKLLRFCFAKQEETLIKAAEILCRIRI